jgi:hypothetical protein
MLRQSRAATINLHDLYLITHPVVILPFHGGVPSFLNCSNLQREVIAAVCELYEARYIPKMSICNCPISSTSAFTGEVLEISDGFEDDHYVEGLGWWDGISLRVSDCPSFDDEVLAALGDEYSFGDGFTCQELRELYISRCAKISVQALKNMVERRWEVSRREIEWENVDELEEVIFIVVRPITKLELDSNFGALLSEEDVAWFESKVGHFSIKE